MKTRIQAIHARRIWDSRGRPTVEVDVTLEGGATGRGIAPAGASRGSHEAIDLRDGGQALGASAWPRRWPTSMKRSPQPCWAATPPTRRPSTADHCARPLAHQISPGRQRHDRHLDGGAAGRGDGNGSAVVAPSLARRARCDCPCPRSQIFGGGAHAGRRVDVQDFLVMPVGAQSFDEAMVMTAEVYRKAGELMLARSGSAGVADEGGWWPNFASSEEAIEMLVRAIDGAGYRYDQVSIALDIAASEFGSQGRYTLGLEKKTYDTDGWLEVLTGWCASTRSCRSRTRSPKTTRRASGRSRPRSASTVQVIGDDFLVTNAHRVREAIGAGSCNAVLLKPNQAGTITETREAMVAARDAGWGRIVSARSGETEDAIIVHLAVGWDAGQLKVGSFARSERMVKWNEGLRIEQALGADAVYAGGGVLPKR